MYHRLTHVEQLLNLVWVLAVASIVLAVAARPCRRCHRHPRHVTVAVLACVAVLLFPVISATDDLHPGSDLSDDAAWRHNRRPAGVLVLVVLVLASLAPLLTRLPNSFLTLEGPLAVSHPGCPRLHTGRAPPPAS